MLDRAYRVHLIGWVIVWCGGAIVVLFPGIISRVAEWLGIGRGVDVVLYIGMMVLVYVVFRLVVRMYIMEQELTHIVRELALREHRGKNKDS